jgi:hypothetical protein
MKGSGRDEFGVIIRNEKGRWKTGAHRQARCRGDPEQVLAANPAWCLATGSVPKDHPVGGADGPAVWNVWQLLNGEAQLGRRSA